MRIAGPAVSALACLLILAPGQTGAADSAWRPRYPSTPLPAVGKGMFRVISVPGQEPPGLAGLQALAVKITDAGGVAVSGAKVVLTARARDVERRMPTVPRVTAELGGGRYRIEGLRFTMAGSWLIEFDITAGGKRDKTILELQIR